MSGFTFDPNTIPPDEGGFDGTPLPVGDYNLVIMEAEVRDTRAGNGKMVKIACDVVDGEFANRKVWHNFNIVNANETCQRIGLGEFRKLAFSIDAAGFHIVVPGVDNGTPIPTLVGKTFKARIGPEKKPLDASNPGSEIKKFFELNAPAGAAPQAAAPQQSATAPGGGSTAPDGTAPAADGAKKMPWEK